MINYKKKYLKYKQKYLMNQISGGSAIGASGDDDQQPVITVSKDKKDVFKLTVDDGKPEEGNIITFDKDIYARDETGTNYEQLLDKKVRYKLNIVKEENGTYEVKLKTSTGEIVGVKGNSELLLKNENLQVELKHNDTDTVNALISPDGTLKLTVNDGKLNQVNFDDDKWSITSKNNIYEDKGDILFTRNEEYILSGNLNNFTFKLLSWGQVKDLKSVNGFYVEVNNNVKITVVGKLNSTITKANRFDLNTDDGTFKTNKNIITFNRNIYASKDSIEYKEVLEEAVKYKVISVERKEGVDKVQLSKNTDGRDSTVSVEEKSQLYFRNVDLRVQVGNPTIKIYDDDVELSFKQDGSLKLDFKDDKVDSFDFSTGPWIMTSEKKIFANNTLLFETGKQYNFKGAADSVSFDDDIQQKITGLGDLSNVTLYSYDEVNNTVGIEVSDDQVADVLPSAPGAGGTDTSQNQSNVTVLSSFDDVKKQLVDGILKAKSDEIPSLIGEIIPKIHNMVEQFNINISQEVEISDKNVGIFGCDLGNKKKSRIFVFRVD